MPLSSNSRALFGACASAIVGRDADHGLNLYPLNSDPVAMSDEAVQYLASAVEAESGDKQTIRRAEVAFFADRVRGANLYLVLCPYDTSPGEVVELTDEMRLISLGPYSNGFDVDAKRASPEAVQSYRDFVAEHKRKEQQRELAKSDVEEFMGWLSRDSPEVAEELRSKPSVTLEDLAVACRKHDLTLMFLLREIVAN